MRVSSTGATRNDDNGKIDYRYKSAVVSRAMGEYMHAHRKQKDGKIRAADNWKHGMPLEWYLKSFRGHLEDFELIMEGHKVTEGDKPVSLWHALFGLLFNLTAFMHELIIATGWRVFERLFHNGWETDDEAIAHLKKEGLVPSRPSADEERN